MLVPSDLNQIKQGKASKPAAPESKDSIDHKVVDVEASGSDTEEDEPVKVPAPVQAEPLKSLPPPPGPPTGSSGLPPPPSGGGAGLPPPPSNLPPPPKNLVPPKPADVPETGKQRFLHVWSQWFVITAMRLLIAVAAPARSDLMSAIRAGVPLKKKKPKKVRCTPAYFYPRAFNMRCPCRKLPLQLLQQKHHRHQQPEVDSIHRSAARHCATTELPHSASSLLCLMSMLPQLFAIVNDRRKSLMGRGVAIGPEDDDSDSSWSDSD